MLTVDFFGPAVWSTTFLQLLLATICGGLIGYQRERQESAAGFRTHVLVCVGSAIFMQVSVLVGHAAHDEARIAAQVASGIGFLGAGTILKQGNIVRGLTTAASLWAVAAIGLAVGYGTPTLVVALLGTLTVFIALSTLRLIERFIGRPHNCYVSFTITDPYQQIEQIREKLVANGIAVSCLEISEGEDGEGKVSFAGRVLNCNVLDRAIKSIAHTNAIRNVRLEYQ